MCRRVHTGHANSSLSGIARRPTGCAPQSRTPAPPEVSGPLGPAAKPNPRARPSLDEPLPRMRLSRARRIPTAIRVNHPPGPKRAADPGRLGANRRPGPERAADPRRLGANRQPRPERAADPRRLRVNRRPGPEPVAGSPRREASAHPKERKSRSHISTSAIVCASTTPATSTSLPHDMVRGCSVMAYIGRRRTSSGPRLPSQTLRTDGFARATPRQCVGKQMPPAGAAARRRFMAQNPHVYGFRRNVAK